MAKRNPLRINVGFLVKADAGYSRAIEFDVGEMVLSDDFTVTDLKGAVTFGRTPQGLVAQVNLSGRTAADCARCLDPFELAIATDFTELYAFDERSVTESQLLVPPSHQIDLAPLAREYLLLDMPITPLCRPDCKGLCTECGANRNTTDCGHPQAAADAPPAPADEARDPRFAALKDLLDPKE